MLPFERKLATECTHCQATAVGKEVPGHVRESIKRQGAAAGVPKYMFSGGVALALLIGVLVFRSHVQEARTANLAAEPQTGDYYVVDYEEALGISEGDLHYGVLRIHSLEEDSIAFDVGSYGYEYHSDARTAVMKGQIDEPGYFYGAQVMFSRDDVRALYDEKHVKRIVRKE